MSDLEKFYIPRFLDEPFRLIFWTIDEALFLFVPFLTLMNFNASFWGFLLGVLMLLVWKKCKKGSDSSRIQSWAFWYSPKILTSLTFTPASYRRIFRR